MEETDIKDRILKGAMELFMKYGVRSVSMDDIARHLSVSKKTIYQYFVDKDDVVTLVATDHMDKGRTEYEDLRESSKNAIDELVKISACLKKDLQEMNPSLLFDLHKYHPKAWSVWLDHKNKYIRDSVVRNINQGIEEGYYRKELNPQVLAAVRIELVQMAFDERVFPHNEINLAEAQIQIFDHFVYGLLTEKGRKLYEKYKLEFKESKLITTP
jgi:TetR/AcrR family transcriptional regulator, cholesterol catabolism regulator